MAKFFDQLDEKLTAFIARQPMFFVATAMAEGRINLSPKGLDSLAVISPTQVAWLDLTGSGNETSTHLAHDGRMTMMFNAFEGPPMILRLYGRGRTIQPQDDDFDAWSRHFGTFPGTRQIIVMDIESLQTSCGYAVPEMDFRQHRSTLLDYNERKGPEGMALYRHKNNRVSIDGLPTGLKQPEPDMSDE